MRQSIAYERKRVLMPLCIFTVIATAIFVVMALSTRFVVNRYYYGNSQPVEVAANTLAYVPAIILGLLCYLVPAMQFSYRMKRRSVDLWYSLPVRREKLMLVRLISGLLLIFIPYTVSFFAGLTVIGCRPNMFEMQYYILLYLASLPLGTLLFGVNSFLFTRANSMFDGIVFMISGMFLILAPVSFLFLWADSATPSHLDHALTNSLHYITFGPMTELYVVFDSAILGNGLSMEMAWIPYTLAAVTGIAAYFGLIYTARNHRAENAEQLSDSPFGYCVQIPFYLFFIAASTWSDLYRTLGSLMLAGYLIMLVIAAAAYFVYRRSFRLKKGDLISLAASFAGGIALSLILSILI